jgi:alkanesulfonate monooxygenase SsuD/methylene tetrahydromethanopterin reductase-like flavin-dependent oxidoreductase (luciferase family)
VALAQYIVDPQNDAFSQAFVNRMWAQLLGEGFVMPVDDMVPEAMRGRMVVGSPDKIADEVQRHVLDAGIDGVILNLPAYVPGSINAVGEALRPILRL